MQNARMCVDYDLNYARKCSYLFPVCFMQSIAHSIGEHTRVHPPSLPRGRLKARV